MHDRTGPITVVTGADGTTGFVDAGDLDPDSVIAVLTDVWGGLGVGAVVTVHSRHADIEAALDQWCDRRGDAALVASFSEGPGTTFTLVGTPVS